MGNNDNRSSERPRIGVAHPRLVQGGSEAACLWAIEALKADHDVTLLTTGPAPWTELNARYGTTIKPGEVSVQRPYTARLFGGYPGAALTGALHERFCHGMANRFDVLLSAYNPCDFGRPAIHRIADFGWSDALREQTGEQADKARGLIHRDTPLRRMYLALARGFRARSGRDLFDGGDLFIVNSDWTGRMMSEHHPRARWTRIYPPVADSFEPLSWKERENGFVCLGRISHEKRLETIIAILDRVRLLGHRIHLHIIGPSDGTPYARTIEDLCRQHGEWVMMEGARHGAGKARLLSTHRYAIHGRRFEPFGIAVAEMVKAGCIAFVPDNGGPPEIVNDERLCYRDADDAVSKIGAVLRDEALQGTLHDHMLARGTCFDVTAYQEGIRRTVRDMLEGTSPCV